MENAAIDLKVRYELREGGAPPDAVIRMTVLNEAYNKVGGALTYITPSLLFWPNSFCCKLLKLALRNQSY